MGTAVALQTARVGVLCGVHGALSTRSGLLSAGVAVRWVVAGSLPNGVSVQSGRVSIMHGGCRCQNRRISGRGSRTVRLGGW